MEKILIIDDSELIRMVLKEKLKNYHVIEAEDGKAGLAIARKERPHLVITDFQMPGMDGLSVLSEIRKMKFKMPVIMLTAFGDVALTIKAIQMGAFDFLEKPINTSQLLSIVQCALQSEKTSKSLTRERYEDISSQGMIEDNMLVGRTPRMKEIFKNIGHMSMTKVNVLIQGETGTGKKLIARLIHYAGITHDQPMVSVSCSTLNESLLESELFGYVKGPFTDSFRDKKGKFELAGDGTIFLDEISEIPLNIQVKLVRVLQELDFEKEGSEETIPMNARIIATTNRNLEDLVKQGKLREDLYYRLKAFTINLPALRERKEDIPYLVIHFLHKFNKRFDKNVVKIDDGVIEMLQEHEWRGNIRELGNTLLQAVVMARNDVLEKGNIVFNIRHHSRSGKPMTGSHIRSLAELKILHIRRILSEVKWNKMEASQILDISRPTLDAKIERYSLEK